MSDDDPKTPASAQSPERDEHESVGHAADLPTAVWDEDSLRAAGVELPPQEEEPRPRGAAPVQVQTVPDQAARKPPPKGLSWPLTIGLAVGLGAAVYFLVRFLR